jgi:PAS domain S-box-containing protein
MSGIVKHMSSDALEQQLQEIKQQFALLMNAVPDFICLKDGDGCWLEANQHALHLFQIVDVPFWRKTDVELAGFSKIFRDTLADSRDHDERAWSTGSPIHSELIIPQQDGTSLIFEVIRVPIFGVEGRRKMLIAIGRNISEQKKAEEALQESESKFRAMFHHTNDAIFLFQLTDDGMPSQFIEVNPVTYQTLGYSRNQFLSMSLMDISNSGILKDIPKIMKDLISDGHITFEWIYLTRVLQDTRLEAHYLDLEITESIIMQDVHSTITTLNELKSMGIQISVDDFGTGFSSLSYLKHFPIDKLKIDQSFVRDINICPKDTAIATTIINMAHNLQLKVIAEGVETQKQIDFLQQQQCDEAQGYLFSKPLSCEKFEKMLDGLDTYSHLLRLK